MSILRYHFGPKLLLLLPVLPLLLGGCVTTGDTAGFNPFAFLTGQEPGDLTPEERELREDASVFRNTVIGGALTVGGEAGLQCILEWGPDELEGCASIAAIGGVVGAIDGYLTAKQQEASRKQVREIDLITQEIEERNAGIGKMVDSSRKVVEQNRERINEVKLQVARNEVREEQLAEEQKRLQANIKVMNRTIDNLMEDKTTYQVLAERLANDGTDVASLRSEVESMSLQIAALEKERDALEEINQTMRIG